MYTITLKSSKTSAKHPLNTLQFQKYLIIRTPKTCEILSQSRLKCPKPLRNTRKLEQTSKNTRKHLARVTTARMAVPHGAPRLGADLHCRCAAFTTTAFLVDMSRCGRPDSFVRTQESGPGCFDARHDGQRRRRSSAHPDSFVRTQESVTRTQTRYL